MFGLILSAVLAATVLTPDTILDRVPGTATLKEMVDAVDNDVDARKQDNLPYPTNAIPASVIMDAPWLLTTESATNYADAVAENQNVYLRSKSDLTVYLGHFGDWTLTRWNETKDMPPEKFRDMSLYALSNIVEVMTDDYGVVTNTGSFEVYYKGELVCTGTNGPVANATMFHPVITFTLPPPEDTRTVSTFVAARLSEVSPTDDRLAKLSDIEGGVSGLVETQALHTVMLEDHAARIAGMEAGKRDLTNNLCVASSFTDWAYEPEPAADYQKLVWMNRSQGYGWYLNGSEEVLITNEENVATLVYESNGTDFTATRTAICRSNELFVTQSAVKDAADETRVAASNYTDRVAEEKSDKFLAWTFTGLAGRGFVDAKLNFKATPALTAAPLVGAVLLNVSSPTVGVWTLSAKTSVDGKWENVGSYMGAEDVTVIDSFEGAETISASRETVLYTKAISSDNPAFSNAVEKIVEKDGPTEFETWTNGVALAAGRNAKADRLNDWTRTIALGSESSARVDGVTVGGESVAGEKGVSVGLRAGKGYSNRTPGSEAVSLGFESSATNKAVALGTGALATNEEAVVIGADAVSHGTGSVTLGKSGTTLDHVFVGSNVVDKLIREEIVYPMIAETTTVIEAQIAALQDAKRDKTDLTIKEPNNVHWVWTSTDPNCPEGWLDIANSYWAPKPVAREELVPGELWGWWITGDIGGYGQATVTTGGKDETSVTINFGPDSDTWIFYATATRASATDTTPVVADGIACTSQLASAEQLLTEKQRMAIADVENKRPLDDNTCHKTEYSSTWDGLAWDFSEQNAVSDGDYHIEIFDIGGDWYLILFKGSASVAPSTYHYDSRSSAESVTEVMWLVAPYSGTKSYRKGFCTNGEKFVTSSYVDDRAAERLAKSDVVKPDASATAGQAADAKDTHDALEDKADEFTKWEFSDGVERQWYFNNGYYNDHDPDWDGAKSPPGTSWLWNYGDEDDLSVDALTWPSREIVATASRKRVLRTGDALPTSFTNEERVAIGCLAESPDNFYGVAIGNRAKSFNNGTAVGNYTSARGLYSTAVGVFANASNEHSTVIGDYHGSHGPGTFSVSQGIGGWYAGGVPVLDSLLRTGYSPVEVEEVVTNVVPQNLLADGPVNVTTNRFTVYVQDPDAPTPVMHGEVSASDLSAALDDAYTNTTARSSVGSKIMTLIDTQVDQKIGDLMAGRTYDFSTTQGLYMAVQDLVEKLGGKVINPYSP